jgi:hypothetical protein
MIDLLPEQARQMINHRRDKSGSTEKKRISYREGKCVPQHISAIMQLIILVDDADSFF